MENRALDDLDFMGDESLVENKNKTMAKLGDMSFALKATAI